MKLISLKHYQKQILFEGQKLLTVSSPFGCLSSEIFKNVFKRACVSKVFQQNELLLLDCITHVGQEGGSVFDEMGNYSGMLLPPIQIGRHNMNYYSFAISHQIILSQLNHKVSDIHTKLSTCIVQQVKYATGTLIQIGKRAYVLTVNHFMSDQKDEVDVMVSNLHRFQAKAIAENTSNLDFQILEVSDPSQDLLDNCLTLDDFCSDFMNKGSEIYMLGYGIINPTSDKKPLISKGIISNVIADNDRIMLYQTDCYAHNGYSGGGIFNQQHKLIGIQSYNISSKSLGIICDINFILPIIHIKPILDELKSWGRLSSESLKIFSVKYDCMDKYQSFQTRADVPFLKPRL